MTSSKDINYLIEETVRFAERWAEVKKEEALQKLEEANLARFTSQALKYAAPRYIDLYNSSPTMKQYPSVTASGEKSWASMNHALKISFEQGQSNLLTASLASTASNIAFSADLLPAPLELIGESSIVPTFPTRPIFQFPKINREGTTKRLRNVNEHLAETYSGVWDAWNGIGADLERIALSQMRQTYDHLLGILAPEKEVRESPYWVSKEDPKPNLVTRRERLMYAVNVHVSRYEIRDLLRADIDNILATYSELHKMHERGALNPSQTQKTIEEMDRIIVEWLDAMGY